MCKSIEHDPMTLAGLLDEHLAVEIDMTHMPQPTQDDIEILSTCQHATVFRWSVPTYDSDPGNAEVGPQPDIIEGEQRIFILSEEGELEEI